MERTIQFLLSSYLSLKPFPESLSSAKSQSHRPEAQKPQTSTSASRPDPRPNLAVELPIEKGKLPETRLSKNTAPELCERTFSTVSPRHSAVTFAGLSSCSSNPGFARGVDQTPNHRTVQATFSQNLKLFSSSQVIMRKGHFRQFGRLRASPAASRRRALETPQRGSNGDE